MGRTIGIPSYLKYNEETGAFFIAKKGVSLERPGMVLLVDDQPQDKLRAFSDMIRLMNAELQSEGEQYYGADDLKSVWEFFDYGFEAGRSVAGYPIKLVTNN